jgi:DNA-binding SARP family transcriptional activator
VVELNLFGGSHPCLILGQTLNAHGHRELTAYHRGWNLLMAIAALPPAEASVGTVGALLWPGANDDADALRNRIQTNMSNVRQVLHSFGLPRTEARKLIRTEAGMCILDRNHVRVDVWDFLDAEHTGNRARVAGRAAEAIAAYERVEALYVGPLLHGQEAVHRWVQEGVTEGLTLTESYQA